MAFPGEEPALDTENINKSIPVLSGAENLDSHIKARYIKKISALGADPNSIPEEQFDPECLPPIEAIDLLGYLVLETSYYTREQFKAYKSSEAYNQMLSGCVTSVRGKIISNRSLRYAVIAKVQHLQRVADPLVKIWIVSEEDGTILSAHCMGCQAGLAESCSHIASVMFYIEAWNRIHGKLACTQGECTWILPNEVLYARVKDINFTPAKKLKEQLDEKINASNDQIQHTQNASSTISTSRPTVQPQETTVFPPSAAEIAAFYAKLNECKIKPVCLSLVAPYADQFVPKSRTVPVVSDLYETENSLNVDD